MPSEEHIINDLAEDLILAIGDALQRPGVQPAMLFAIARHYLDEARAQERVRAAQVAYDYAAKQEGASDYWAFAAATSIAAAIRALE